MFSNGSFENTRDPGREGSRRVDWTAKRNSAVGIQLYSQESILAGLQCRAKSVAFRQSRQKTAGDAWKNFGLRKSVRRRTIRSICGGSMDPNRNIEDDDTVDMLRPAAVRHRAFPIDPASSRIEVDIAGLTHTGHVRTNNEDHYLVVRIARSLKTMMTNLIDGSLPENFEEVAYGMLVADGMGGYAAGEVASSLALVKLIELAVETPDWVMRMHERENADTVMRRMTERFRIIDSAMRVQAESDPSLVGMGTTLTVVVSLGAELFVGHLGDSRAYLFRNKRLHQLTRDNTLAQELIDAGIARAEDTATQAMRHVLTSALAAGDQADPQVQRFHLSDGDQILLCTDGLTGMVRDETIATILNDAPSAAAACQSLIDLALAAGGSDNATVVLARYRFPVSE